MHDKSNEIQAKKPHAHLTEAEALHLPLTLPDGARMPVEKMTVEDFIDAIEICIRPLDEDRKEHCRKLVYEGKIPYEDKYKLDAIDLADLFHRWYVLEELCRLGVKLPELPKKCEVAA
jgi:hypothetical protein